METYTFKINSKHLIKANRKAKRDADIHNGVNPFQNKIHKSKKAYNRQESKRVEYE